MTTILNDNFSKQPCLHTVLCNLPKYASPNKTYATPSKGKYIISVHDIDPY